MQTTVSDAGQLRKKLTISIPQSEIAERRNKLLERYASQVQMKGFRPGKKPPRSLIEKRLGSSIDDEVFQILVEEGVSQGIKDNALKPIGQISTEESQREGDITHTVAFDVQPEIVLPEPASIPVAVVKAEVSDADLDEELASMAKRMGEFSDLGGDDTIAKDDIVTLSGSVTHAGEKIRDLQDLQHMVGAYPLLGLEPDEIVAKVSTLKVGEVLSFSSTLPDSFTPEEHAGKAAEVSLTIQSARRQVPAAIDEAFAKRFGIDNVETLKDRIKSSMTSRKEEEIHNQQSEEVMNYLIAHCQFELPEKLRQDIVDQQIAQEKEKSENVDEAKVIGDVEKDLRRHLITEAIAEQLKVSASQQDLNQQITMAAYQSGRKPEEIAKQLQESGRIQQVAMEIRSAKAVGMFVEQVVAAKGGKQEETSEDSPA
ncbi:MAG: trigger factor [Planctomycetota bacterium]|nr:MAG: trigger factor [Planctomycetota bacterium]